MRDANLTVSVLGIAGLSVAAACAWKWRNRPLLTERSDGVETRRTAALNGLRNLAAVMAAGVVAGFLVPGLGGRLVMRILAATSGDAAQGAGTQAGESVGTITQHGSIGVILFVGIFGGVMAALAFLVVRRWLPSVAGSAGLVTAVLLLGTFGVGDPMSPDNVDFAILHPTSLALALIVALAGLFGVTFAALAARLDAGMPTLGLGPARIASHGSLVFYAFPPLLLYAVLYVTGLVVLRGRLRPILTSPTTQRVGRVIVAVATILAAANAVRAVTKIMVA